MLCKSVSNFLSKGNKKEIRKSDVEGDSQEKKTDCCDE